VWPALDRVVLTALAQRPEDRFQTAASFAAALQETLSARDEPDLAGPPTSEHAGDVFSPEALPHEAPTLPAIPLVESTVMAHVRVAVDNVVHSPRALMVTLLLVAALGGGALASGFGLLRGSQTVFMPGPVVTATLQPSVNVTSSPFGTPTAQATTIPIPTATDAPQFPLAIDPTPLVLVPLPQDTHTCSATQVITNHAGQTLGWAWEKPAVGGFEFAINGGPQVNWPSNTSSGIAPGGHDTVSASSDCKPRSFAVLMTDTRGNQYPFVVRVQ
jgi:hypothetical protein